MPANIHLQTPMSRRYSAALLTHTTPNKDRNPSDGNDTSTTSRNTRKNCGNADTIMYTRGHRTLLAPSPNRPMGICGSGGAGDGSRRGSSGRRFERAARHSGGRRGSSGSVAGFSVSGDSCRSAPPAVPALVPSFPAGSVAAHASAINTRVAELGKTAAVPLPPPEMVRALSGMCARGRGGWCVCVSRGVTKKGEKRDTFDESVPVDRLSRYICSPTIVRQFPDQPHRLPVRPHVVSRHRVESIANIVAGWTCDFERQSKGVPLDVGSALNWQTYQGFYEIESTSFQSCVL